MMQEAIGFLCSMFTLIAFSGFIFYLPLKSHWSKIFSFLDAMSFYCGIGCAGLLIYFTFLDGWSSVIDTEGLGSVEATVVSIIVPIIISIFMIGTILWGFMTLIACWQNCSNTIEIILLPFIMISAIGVFVIEILIIAIGLISLRDDSD